MKNKTLGELIDSISITHKFDKEKLIFLNTSDISEGKILVNDYYLVSNLKGQAKKTIQFDDILFSEIRPKNKRYAYVNIKDTEDYIVSTKLMVLRNKTKDVLTKYIYYFLTYEGTLNYLQMRAENRIGSFPQITFDILKPINISIPSLDEQKKIVNIVSALDDKIELNNNINAELEQMAKTLYDYWFVQFDFPNEEGKPYKSSGGKMVYNKVLKREIPEGWEVKKLCEITNIIMGQSPSGESYNEEGNGMIFFQGSTDFGWRFPENRVYTTQPTRFAKENDILLSVRAPIGTMNLAMKDCCIGRGLAALNEKNGNSSFLIYQMNYFKKKFDYLNSVGTTFGSLTKDELYKLELVYPSKNILKQFEKTVSTFDNRIKINIKQNQELASLRDWLLPMLMNGQVKVAD